MQRREMGEHEHATRLEQFFAAAESGFIEE